MESWFMLEMITTGSVSVWETDRSHGGGRRLPWGLDDTSLWETLGHFRWCLCGARCVFLLNVLPPPSLLPLTHLQLHLQTLVHVLHHKADDM